MILGLDIGNVIIGGRGEDTSFIGKSVTPEELLKTPEVRGAFAAIQKLVPLFEAVHLVSKAYPNTQRKTREWLKGKDFFTRTGVKEENMHFCLERPEKRLICEQQRIDIFVDDRWDILDSLRGTVTYRILFGPQSPKKQDMDGMQFVLNWTECTEAIEWILERSSS